MKNNNSLTKLVLAAILILTIGTFSFAQPTIEPVDISLLSICGSSSDPGAGGSSSTPPDCAGSIQVNMDNRCETMVEINIFMVNVVENPDPNVTYQLPAEYPSFFVRHEVSPGEFEITGPLREFKFLTSYELSGVPFNLFGIPLDIPIYNAFREWGECGPKNANSFRITPKVSLLRSDKAGGPDDYIPYPVGEHSDHDEIFDCRYYEDISCTTGSDMVAMDLNVYMCLHCNDCDNGIKPQGDGDKSGTHTGDPDRDNSQFRQQLSSTDFQLSPNPFTDILELNIAIPEGEFATLSIFDFQGRVVLKDQLTNTKSQFNVDQLPVGVYYLKVRTSVQEQTQKIIKIE